MPYSQDESCRPAHDAKPSKFLVNSEGCFFLHEHPHSSARAIQQAMAKKPANRFATASQFISALEAA